MFTYIFLKFCCRLDPAVVINADVFSKMTASEKEKVSDTLAEEKRNSRCIAVANEITAVRLESSDTGEWSTILLAVGASVFAHIREPECAKMVANFIQLLHCVFFWKQIQDQAIIEEIKESKKLMTSQQDRRNADANESYRNLDMLCTNVFSLYVPWSLYSVTSWPFLLKMGERRNMELQIIDNGFALLASVIKHICTNTLDKTIGDALPFSDPKGARLSSMRHLLVIESGFVAWTLEVAQRRDASPVLLRSTLYLMVFFISENPPLENSRTLDSTVATAHEISSEYAIQESMEWALEIMKKYPRHYSLQSLAVMFLLWMERHGRLANRSVERLEDMKSVLLQILRTRIDAYLTLDEEGYDLSYKGRSRLEFGHLSVHSDMLLRRVEFHLSEHLPKKIDASCHLVDVRLDAVETEEDPISHRPCSVYVMTVAWNKPKAPLSVATPAAASAVTPSVGISSPISRRMPSRVKGDKSDEASKRLLTWRITRRFRRFRELRSELLKILRHLKDGALDEDSPFGLGQIALGNMFLSLFRVSQLKMRSQ